VSDSARLRQQDYQAIFRLAGECRELGDDHRHWRLHFLAGLATLVSADVSVGAEVSGIASLRPHELTDTPADWGFDRGFDKRGWLRALELLQSDPSYTCLLKHYLQRGGQDSGQPMRRSDLLPNHDWQRSREYDEAYRTMEIDHSITCFRFIPGLNDVALGSVVGRAKSRRDFSGRELAILRETFAAVAPMVGGALARVEEPSPGDLPPRVRQVLRCVLRGDSDKQIAVRLGISRHTVNQYLKVIFSHFNAAGRSNLLARWISRGWGARVAWADD
jgi:DNA-binding CsgD family transcriptional regulator